MYKANTQLYISFELDFLFVLLINLDNIIKFQFSYVNGSHRMSQQSHTIKIIFAKGSKTPLHTTSLAL